MSDFDGVNEITSLRAEVERLRAEVATWQRHAKTAIWSDSEECKLLTAETEWLRAALRECELELNAHYRMKYPGDHPYSQQELAQAMASNPATVALSGG